MAEKITRVQFKPEYIVIDEYDNDNGSKVINDFANGKVIKVALTSVKELNADVDKGTVKELRPGEEVVYDAGLGERYVVVLKPDVSTTSIYNVYGVKVINE
jgi:hypothetical protein